MTDFAPSEEFVLHCDVPGCTASLSMVASIGRSQHGWGRCSLYNDSNLATDYDLCNEHYDRVRAVLGVLACDASHCYCENPYQCRWHR